MGKNKFIVFTKPWKGDNYSVEKLGELVADMGFDGVEYPYRGGYQLIPENGAKDIVRIAKILKTFNVSIDSIAGGIDVKYTSDNKADGLNNEDLFAACQEAGVKIIRICQGLDKKIEFWQNIAQIKRAYDAALPACEKYGVTIGVQMHCNDAISNSAETQLLLQDYDPKYIAAVWDSGHNGLAGTEPCFGIDTIYDKLCMVNFKAAYWQLATGPEADEAHYHAHWTTGKHACGKWSSAVEHLKKRGFDGVVCMPAEYSDEPNVEKYTREDLKYLKELFAK